jgi:DNA-binding response OmpR family regulator
MVVEDDEDTRALLRVLFETAGFRVAECVEGDQVLPTIAALRPDLVVINGRLPGEDGWSVCHRLRRAEDGIKHTPVIFVSAGLSSSSEARAFEAGCNLFFPKPYNIYKLLLAVRELLDSRQYASQ